MDDKNYWGSTDLVYQCLIDRERTLAFGESIKNCISKDNIVVDLGAGSGVMSLFALKYGAKKVYAVEIDPFNCSFLKKTAKKNGYEERLIIINQDATQVVLPEKVDIVICEMIATGLFDELEIPAMNNIKKFTNPGAKYLPSIMDFYVDLVDTDNIFYGHEIEFVHYEYGSFDDSNRRKAIQMTENFKYKSVDYSSSIKDLSVNFTEELTCKIDGRVNGLRFTNISTLPDGTKLGGTTAYCMPLIFPIDEVLVKKNQIISLHVDYQMCAGLHNLKAFIS